MSCYFLKRRSVKCSPLKEELVEIGEEIGRGAYGVVVKGMYADTPVAMKVLHRDLADLDRDKLFRDEIEMLLSIRHPHIVSIVAHDDNALVMQLASGGSLRTILTSDSIVSHEDIVLIARDCLRALVYLHTLDRCIVHSDIKPDNILVDVDRSGRITRAFLGDVGISRTCSEADGNHSVQYFYMHDDRVQNSPGAEDDYYALGFSLVEAWFAPFPVTFDNLSSALDGIPFRAEALCESLIGLISSSPSLEETVGEARERLRRIEDVTLMRSDSDRIETSLRVHFKDTPITERVFEGLCAKNASWYPDAAALGEELRRDLNIVPDKKTSVPSSDSFDWDAEEAKFANNEF